MKAVMCPVCLGTGKVKEETCHGCSGKGWVEVREDEVNYYPYYPYYPYTYPYWYWYPYNTISYWISG